jgi:hypothetical protein
MGVIVTRDIMLLSRNQELTGMYAPGCPSLSEARMTEEQAERLRKRRKGGSPDTVSRAKLIRKHRPMIYIDLIGEH